MKKITLKFASVLLILGAISLMNFAIPQTDPLTDTSLPSSFQFMSEVTIDCFIDCTRPGGNDDNYWCEGEVNDKCYQCIYVTDAVSWAVLSTCSSGGGLVE